MFNDVIGRYVSSVLPEACVLVCSQPSMYVRTWMCAQSNMYMDVCTVSHVHGCVHSLTCTWMCAQSHMYMDVCTVSHVHGCVHSLTCTWMCAQSHMYMDVCTVSHVHGCVHSLTCTWMCAQSHMYMDKHANVVRYVDCILFQL